MLKTYHTITDLQQILFHNRQKGGSIGFVPTMGALHQGHVSLISLSRQQTDATVASIFVNPTQFNDREDFVKYPRDTEHDRALLKDAGCDFLFLPDEQEMYPTEQEKNIDFDPGMLGSVLEGKSRPGHFKGMAAVVKRLLDIVIPDKAFFGQKDYQQYLIVKKMVEYYQLPVEIVRCPIIRESNGLAMSSRNVRLLPEHREKAGIIYRSLAKAAESIKSENIDFEEIKRMARAEIEEDGNFTVDYFDICSANSLETLSAKSAAGQIVVLTAVYVDGVRLIDNILV